MKSDERGDSLVEVSMALMVLSLGIVGLMAALGTGFSTTAINRDQSHATNTLNTAAEHVKSRATPPCGGGTTAISAADVPRPTWMSTVNFGPVQAADGYTCAELRSVRVTVSGNGFTLMTDVVKRP